MTLNTTEYNNNKSKTEVDEMSPEYQGRTRLVLTDIDDVWAEHRRFGNRNLSYAREAGPRIAGMGRWCAITGNAYGQIEDVVEASGMQGPHLAEYGMVVKHPGRNPGLFYSCTDHPVIPRLQQEIQRLSMDGVPGTANRYGIGARVMDKMGMLSIELDGNHGERFIHEVLDKLLDPQIQRLREGEQLVFYDRGFAVDALPADVNKGTSAEKLRRELGVPTEYLCVGGDADSDLDMWDLVERDGRAFCPANASEAVKARTRAMGERGYVSRYTCRDGAILDVLDYMKSHWM